MLYAKDANFSTVKGKEWKVVHPSDPGLFTEDVAIWTVDDEEVVGCSEWMRADDITFEYIVELHNIHVRRGVAR